MAGCDNLYGNLHQWRELFDFLRKKKPEYLEYMKAQPSRMGKMVRICYIAEIQGWLIDNCPFEWVKEQLEENFLIQSMICGKPHHEGNNG